MLKWIINVLFGEENRARRRPVRTRPSLEPLEDRQFMAADLQGWWVNAPPEAKWGSNVSLVQTQVRNAGNTASGSFDVEFYLSKDPYGSGDDLRLLRADGFGALYNQASILAFSTGLMFYPTLKLPASPPAGFSGESFYIVMKTDATNKVFESNENNNFGGLGLTYDNDQIRITGGSSGLADLSGWWTCLGSARTGSLPPRRSRVSGTTNLVD